MENANFTTLLTFFKVLADETRLKIVGLLAEAPYSVGELANILGLRAPTISHHLARLVDANLLYMERDGTTHYYHLHLDYLRQLHRELLIPEQVSVLAHDKTWEEKALENFLDGQRLKVIPRSYRKRLVVLQWLTEKFQTDRRYSEAEVNAIIQQHHEDSATLRRELVMNKYMARENDAYWRLPAEETYAHTQKLLKSAPLRQDTTAG